MPPILTHVPPPAAGDPFDNRGRESFQHLALTPQENERQRGEPPAGARPNDRPPPEPPTAREIRARRAVESWVARQGRMTRAEALWPYLLIRAKEGDHGVRSPRLTRFWCSPDILVFPGNVADPAGQTPTLSP